MLKISKKLVDVMRECSHVAKNGTNDFHHYDYATAADVLDLVNDSLTKHGIASIVTNTLLSMRDSNTAKGNVEHLATVEVAVTLIDSESGESVTIKGLGSGQDAGDKAVAKAQTMGIKYAYLTSLAIATGDDPEADTHTDEVMSNAPARPVPAAISKTVDKLICHDCGKPISQKVADFSKSQYNRQLCFNCQKAQNHLSQAS